MASSSMQGSLKTAWNTPVPGSLTIWGREYLVPAKKFAKCPRNMEVLVPYIAKGRWSLFIITKDSLLHLDIRAIHIDAKDKEFAS